MQLTGRDFLREADFTAAELDSLLRLAADLKQQRHDGNEYPRLVGKQLALIFEKPSTRTRLAFEIAMHEQGGHVTSLDSNTQIRTKESIADSARVIERMFDAIEYRGTEQAVVEELAAAASVPVYNGLTDQWHPTQMLADFLTMREHQPGHGQPQCYAYVGDARFNMGNSLLVTGAIMGSDVRIVAPRELWPADDVQALARQQAEASGARLLLTEDPAEGLPGADFVHTDVWVSMGEPRETWADRVSLLMPYRVDAKLMALTGKETTKFMHCLPAFHDTRTLVGATVAEEFGLVDGVEVANEVFESPASVVFDQAENRLHTIKALLVATLT